MPDDERITLTEQERTAVIAEIIGGQLYEFLNGSPGCPATPSFVDLEPSLKQGYIRQGRAFLLYEKGAA